MSKDELREKIGSIVYGLPESSYDGAIDKLLNLLEGETESYYKKGYKDAEEDCTAIWVAKIEGEKQKERATSVERFLNSLPKNIVLKNDGGYWMYRYSTTLEKDVISLFPVSSKELATLNKEPNKGEDVDG